MRNFLSRRGAVEPFHAMDVLANANRLRAQGRRIVSLAVGQPGDPAPRPVLEAARRALETGRIGYTDALGLVPLREAIATHYREHYGVEVPASRVVVTTGSSAAFNLAFLTMFDVGDRVAISVPGYPAYRNIMAALGLEVVEIPIGDAGYLSADALMEAHENRPLRGVLFASPANPTGAAIPAGELQRLLGAAREASIAVISDEIYHRLNFVGPDTTALAYDEQAVVINSFSKYYCMTGWRVGWMVLPDVLTRQVERLAQSLYISPPELSQLAAIAAFDAREELEVVKERYRLNRALLEARLPAIGFRLAAPMDGAFYTYCDVTAHTNDSMVFARRMLEECGVAATPGSDFDPREGGRYMRLSYAGSPEDIAEGVERMQRWLKG